MTVTDRSRANRTIDSSFLLLLAAAIVAVGVLAVAAHPTALSPINAIILGAVEGITEFLPISSTGHLLIVQRLSGLGTGAGKDAADTYAIAIQLGAIVAVIGIYRSQMAVPVRRYALAGLPAGVLAALFAWDGVVSRVEGVVLVAAYVVFVSTIWLIERQHLLGPMPDLSSGRSAR